MEKFIEVYDDIIPQRLANILEDIVLKSRKIPFVYLEDIATTTSNSEMPSPGFGCDFIGSKETFLKPFGSLFLEVLYRLCHFKNILIQEIFLGRMFIHLPSPNPISNHKHRDLDHPHWVCLYYFNDSEGDTILFNDKEEEIQRITPKKGRIVFFDGSILHCSSNPQNKTRAILNFDFIGKVF